MVAQLLKFWKNRHSGKAQNADDQTQDLIVNKPLKMIKCSAKAGLLGPSQHPSWENLHPDTPDWILLKLDSTNSSEPSEPWEVVYASLLRTSTFPYWWGLFLVRQQRLLSGLAPTPLLAFRSITRVKLKRNQAGDMLGMIWEGRTLYQRISKN